jgi:hypothetical protein
MSKCWIVQVGPTKRYVFDDEAAKNTFLLEQKKEACKDHIACVMKNVDDTVVGRFPLRIEHAVTDDPAISWPSGLHPSHLAYQLGAFWSLSEMHMQAFRTKVVIPLKSGQPFNSDMYECFSGIRYDAEVVKKFGLDCYLGGCLWSMPIRVDEEEAEFI